MTATNTAKPTSYKPSDLTALKDLYQSLTQFEQRCIKDEIRLVQDVFEAIEMKGE